LYSTRKNWTNKHVDLEKLIDTIGEFFKAKDFEALKTQTENGYQILAGDSAYYKFTGVVTLTLEGKPDNFSINVELAHGKKRSLPGSIMLITMFGGGYFLTKQLKSDEEWIRFESDLWAYVNTAIANLTGTAA
jgi:hypothetical protein